MVFTCSRPKILVPALQVLPALHKQSGELMLRALIRRWDIHKVMVRWLSRLFNYPDRTFVARKNLPTLTEVGLQCFKDLVSEIWLLPKTF